ncbi:MAG: 1-acyl-sn-glycerol-3-phosphate acyltransferase [Saprospiraceae bacterium]|nr:1-acyl-sn-glycerol-3-phosphate acyltransferase [Saprospiraceae bacterium]
MASTNAQAYSGWRGAISKAFSRFVLGLMGWKVTGHYDNTIPKKIIAVAPHTSNWDFPIGLLARPLIEDWVQFVMKASLFKPPIGWLMRALGGIPVDRKKSTNFVSGVVREFEQRDKLTVLFAIEGTRKRVERLKTGYYYVATQAKIPIILFRFDHAKKEIHFSKPFYPSDDAQADQKFVEDYFRGVQGRIPENGFGWEEVEKPTA